MSRNAGRGCPRCMRWETSAKQCDRLFAHPAGIGLGRVCQGDGPQVCTGRGGMRYLGRDGGGGGGRTRGRASLLMTLIWQPIMERAFWTASATCWLQLTRAGAAMLST